MAQKVEDRAYIQSKLDDILKPMLTKMFVSNPSDPVSTISWADSLVPYHSSLTI